MGGQQAAAGTPFTPAADGAAFTRKLATGGPSRFTAWGRSSIQAGRFTHETASLSAPDSSRGAAEVREVRW